MTIQTPFVDEVEHFRKAIEESGFASAGQSDKGVGGRRALGTSSKGQAQIALRLGPTNVESLSGVKVLRTQGRDATKCSVIYKEFSE